MRENTHNKYLLYEKLRRYDTRTKALVYSDISILSNIQRGERVYSTLAGRFEVFQGDSSYSAQRGDV